MVETHTIQLQTEGRNHIIDITSRVKEVVERSKVDSGIVTIFVKASTAALMINENEAGLLSDFSALMEDLVPQGRNYKHDLKWGESNAHSHLRSILTGHSLTIPLVGKKLTLGTWQQIFLIDFDIRPRTREVVIQIIGEKEGA